jgi:hypothetical protein
MSRQYQEQCDQMNRGGETEGENTRRSWIVALYG